ncbi:MAG TPA: putative zinc-binding metallopeptidase [Chitinophagaceae bacterium]|nr:putative zinc-binding metallopeptidase [Chitinophagaceae bacterium]
MKSLRIIITAVSLALVLVSCEREEELGNVDNIPGLGGDTWTPTAIDKWIVDSLTTPYNITAKYKWDQSELPLNRILVPPKEEKVIPTLSSIRRGWIQPYVDEAGLLFFKQISPKFFTLVGSPSYNSDGSITLGTAEGGRKVVLYELNEFRVKGMPGYVLADTTRVLRMFWVIHHEFAHILDQNVKFPLEFSESSASSYTSDWTNVTPQEALNEGFVSQYAISGKEDDWAEMVSFMLVYGREWFDNRVNSINYTGTTANGTTAAEARARLRQKEAAVVSYFKQAWNIEFYNLQLRSRYAINSLLY